MAITQVATDPSRDVRDRVAAESEIEEFPDKIWFHRTAAAVIDAGRCVRCGTCIAACPSNSIGVAADGLPTLIRMCTGCSSCWDFCPLAGLRTEELARRWAAEERRSGDGGRGLTPRPPLQFRPASGGDPGGVDGRGGLPQGGTEAPPCVFAFGETMGPVRAAYEARAKQRVHGAQDGGVVTAVLETLLAQGYVQGALLSQKENALHGRTVLASTVEQVRQCAGSVYDQTLPLAELAQGLPMGVDEIALVGTPCQIAGLRALQLFPWRYRKAPAEKVKLTVALFCTRSFDFQRLTLELVRQGLPLSKVTKVDIREGRFHAYDATGAVLFETKVDTLRGAGLRGCDECADFTGELADIAVGNVGSRRGWTTVLIRSRRGADAWERSAPALDAEPLSDVSPVAALGERNRQRAVRIRRGVADGQLWVRYTEHLAAYAGTDRAAVSPPVHRSHHYTVSC